MNRRRHTAPALECLAFAVAAASVAVMFWRAGASPAAGRDAGALFALFAGLAALASFAGLARGVAHLAARFR